MKVKKLLAKVKADTSVYLYDGSCKLVAKFESKNDCTEFDNFQIFRYSCEYKRINITLFGVWRFMPE